MELRTLSKELSLQLKLNDGNRLVHSHVQFIFIGQTGAVLPFQPEERTGIIAVDPGGKRCQRDHIDAVSVLQNVEIPISRTNSENRGDTGQRSCGSSHPDNVMVAPADIQRMIAHQTVHDSLRTRTPVIDITQNMQMIHNHLLNQMAECHDKIFSSLDIDDRINNRIIVRLLVQNIRLLRDQLLDHIGIVFRQLLTHL